MSIEQAANNYKNQFPDKYINENIYIAGAKWMIEKACKWLESMDRACAIFDEDEGICIMSRDFVKYFRQAMEE